MKVLIGMSGGVDSSVAAFLLKKQGYEVIGATMLLTDNMDKSIMDAKNICDKLNIKHYVFDFKKEFKEIVISNFINTYKEGKTPNPCVLCNKYFKFGLFYSKAKELGCDYIATGHYAKICKENLCKAKNKAKDQTYFLYDISKDVLKHIIFPLSDFDNKEQIYSIAKENNLIVDKIKESQEICFIPNDDYKTFIKDFIKNQEGNFVLEKNNKVLGIHKGIYNYTIGQRKGLGISYKEPLYVTKIDNISNTVYLGTEDELYSNKLYVKDVNLFGEIKNPVDVCIRYHGKLAKANVYKIDENLYEINLLSPLKSITEGQSVVFYDNGICIGGGIITRR